MGLITDEGLTASPASLPLSSLLQSAWCEAVGKALPDQIALILVGPTKHKEQSNDSAAPKEPDPEIEFEELRDEQAHPPTM